jgi:hypothetical protein
MGVPGRVASTKATVAPRTAITLTITTL